MEKSEKMVVTGIFCFTMNVFKCFLSYGYSNLRLCGKGLPNNEVFNQVPNNTVFSQL